MRLYVITGRVGGKLDSWTVLAGSRAAAMLWLFLVRPGVDWATVQVRAGSGPV